MPFADEKEPRILAIEHEVLVLFKPGLWHSVFQHGNPDASREPDVVSWLAAHADALPESELKHAALRFGTDWKDRFSSELGLLYRLDRETSGIMLCALSRGIFQELEQAQRASRLSKRYVLLSVPRAVQLKGFLPPSCYYGKLFPLGPRFESMQWEIESRFRPYGPKGARVACIDPSIVSRKVQRTEIYRTQLSLAGLASTLLPEEKKLPGGTLLLEAEIRKGFRHQIRAHCAWYGLPILGDRLYGGAVSERLWLEACRVRWERSDQEAIEWNLDILMARNASTEQGMHHE